MHAKLVLSVFIALVPLSTGLQASSLVLNASGTYTEAFQGKNPSNGTFTGTVTFNTSTFQVTSENIQFSDPGGAFSFVASSLPVVSSIPSPSSAASNYSYVNSGNTTVQVLDTLNGLNVHALNFTVSDALLTSYNGDPFLVPRSLVRAQN